MHVYRIAYRRFSKSPLDGEGSFQVGGRWSSPGRRVAYTSTTLTLAMLEFLAHIETSDFAADAPPALVAVTAILKDDDVVALSERHVRLPRDWRSTPAPAALRAVGDDWIADAASLALELPSAMIPRRAAERNVLINPQHPRFHQVRWTTEPFVYDRRLLS